MATMYSLFLGFLFTVVCSDNGDGGRVLKPDVATPSYVMSPVVEDLFRFIGTSTDFTGLNYNRFLSFLEPREAHFVAWQLLCSKLRSNLRRKLGCLFRSIGRSKSFISKLTSYAVRPIRLHFVSLKVTGGVRDQVINIASAELGVREATGNNDGLRVEEYLRYTNLGKGYEWCASFVSWVYGQAGFAVPRNPWSPALFPNNRVYWKAGKFVDSPVRKSANSRIGKSVYKADVFGIYGAKVKRINHVGLVKKCTNDYLITIEGNSNDRVESRRRHLRTIYALADWAH